MYIYIYIYHLLNARGAKEEPLAGAATPGGLLRSVFIISRVYMLTFAIMKVLLKTVYMFYIKTTQHSSKFSLELFGPGCTVSFHNSKSLNFKLSVSNPKHKYVAYLSVLSQISYCQGLGRKNKDEILKTDRNENTENAKHKRY